MFSSEAWLANPSSGFYNGVATQSLRFDDGSSAYLSRTLGTADNKKKWVWSGWVKRSELGGSVVRIFNANDAGSPFKQTSLRFDSDQLRFFNDVNSNADVKTSAVFRDVSAWYHILIAIDTTQTTSSNRIKIYVNGSVVTDLATSTYPNVNTEMYINEARSHTIGASVSASQLFDGYMAEVNFIDGLSFFSDTSGTANTSFNINSFGETKNGVWIPIKYTGSYGTNGFRLQFNQTGTGTASASTIGADTSGNTHHFTSSGIVASDCAMPDNPENNFATLNSLYATANTNVTLSEGNLKAAVSQVAYQNTFSNFGVSSGKWYVEMKQNGTTNSSNMMGISSDNNFSILQSTSSYIGSDSGGENYAFYMHNGQKYSGGSGASYGSRTTDGQIIGVALDLDNGKIYFSVDGTYIASGDPAGGTGFAYENIASSTYYFGITLYTNGIPSCVWNFGQDSTFVGTETATSNADGNGYGAFHTAPPSGFLALCTSNLPEPTISPNSDTQADDHFNTVLYTGNESSRSIAVGFQSDWVWIKNRETTRYHRVYDSSRGATKALYTNGTDAEETNSTELTAFNSSGFTLGAGVGSNENNDTFVSWNWKANGGTTVTNEDGSIDSTVQANTTAGFSIVTYTASASSSVYTIGHGLTKAPELIINKNRDSAGAWWSFTTLIDGSVDYVRLDGTNAKANDTASLGVPTTSVFSQVENYTPASSNNVAYCFHSVEGFSRFGSYTGNGSTDGTFVFTGFRPAFVMIKRTNGTGSWNIADTKRSPENEVDEQVQANLNNAESTSFDFDFFSNGFKARTTDSARNANGGTYIYMAFAEAPFKYANAR